MIQFRKLPGLHFLVSSEDILILFNFYFLNYAYFDHQYFYTVYGEYKRLSLLRNRCVVIKFWTNITDGNNKKDVLIHPLPIYSLRMTPVEQFDLC